MQTSFCSLYGSELDRLDYRTSSGTRSLYGVTVTSERPAGIFVRATQLDNSGGHMTERFIQLRDIRGVHVGGAK